jgi:small-conductance mechanosensitive channel
MRSFLILFICLFEISSVAQAKDKADTTLKFNPDSATVLHGYPVAPFGDTLFYIYEGVGPTGAKTRAFIATKRIEVLDEEGIFQADSFKIEEFESTEFAMYEDIPVMGITKKDAEREGMTQLDLAQKWLDEIRKATIDYHDEFSLRNLIKSGLLLVLLLLVILVLIYGVNRLFKLVYASIERRFAPKIREDGRAQRPGLPRITALLIRVAKWAKVILIIFLVYASLPAFIYLVPASEELTNTLLNYTFTPLKEFFQDFIAFIPNLFTIVVIIVIFAFFIRALRIITEQIRDGFIIITGFYPDWAMSTFSIVRFVLLAFMFIVIFPYLPGSSSPVFQGVSVFLGFLISMGSAGSVSNVISGIMITYMRAFQLGDRIRVGDVEGDVVEKSLLVTRIKTIKEEEISVPNSTLMNGTVKNFSMLARERGLIIFTSVTIGYDAPWRDVHAALLSAASKTESILAEPRPFVLQMALNDFYVEYQINGYIHNAKRMIDIYSDLRQNIQDAFFEAGIEIMSSHYMNIRDGNKTTIPKNYLPKDYEQPGFKIEQNKTGDDHSNNFKMKEE